MDIFTDGSAINNTQNAPTGAAVLFVKQKLLLCRSMIGTNNIGELDAMRYALRVVNQNIKQFGTTINIYSDSMYTINAVTGKNKAKANAELIEKCKYYLNELKSKHVKVNIKHVKAHTNKKDYLSMCNAIVDNHACMAAKENTSNNWHRTPFTEKESEFIESLKI